MWAVGESGTSWIRQENGVQVFIHGKHVRCVQGRIRPDGALVGYIFTPREPGHVALETHVVQICKYVHGFSLIVVNNQIRTVVKDGEAWFVAKDVAEVLGYKDTDKAVRTHCKCAELFRPAEMAGLETNPKGMTCIPERDVYRLIMKSKLPSAEKFEEWG